MKENLSVKYCEEVLSAPNEREVTMPELLLEMRAAAMEGDVVRAETRTHLGCIM